MLPADRCGECEPVSSQNQTTKKRRTKPDPWQPVRDRIADFAARYGLAVEARSPAAPQYQVALLTGDSVRLVVYPATSTTGSQHARIRDENSRDKTEAERLMALSGLWIRNKGSWTGDKLREAESNV